MNNTCIFESSFKLDDLIQSVSIKLKPIEPRNKILTGRKEKKTKAEICVVDLDDLDEKVWSILMCFNNPIKRRMFVNDCSFKHLFVSNPSSNPSGRKSQLNGTELGTAYSYFL